MNLRLYAAAATLLLSPLAAPAWAQEKVSEEEVLAAIEKVRTTYDLADERVREGVQAPAPGAQARGAVLRPAEEALTELIADMEALLAPLAELQDRHHRFQPWPQGLSQPSGRQGTHRDQPGLGG